MALRYVEDLSEAQTAELMGCSVGTVKRQTAAGLAKLRVRLSPGVDLQVVHGKAVAR